MFDKLKKRIAHTSKEELKKECQKHAPEIFAVTMIVMLGYLCIKVNSKPVNVTVNVNGGTPWTNF